METRSCLITKIKNLIEIIRRSSSVKLIPKSVFHSFQRIFTLKIFYCQNSRTRIASIFPSRSIKITGNHGEIVYCAGKEKEEPRVHPQLQSSQESGVSRREEQGRKKGPTWVRAAVPRPPPRKEQSMEST